jgi:hypothetical protein
MHEPAGSSAAAMGIYERGGGEGSRMMAGHSRSRSTPSGEGAPRGRQLGAAPVSGGPMWCTREKPRGRTLRQTPDDAPTRKPESVRIHSRL